MNTELFFYTLTKQERDDMVRFVANLLKDKDYTSPVLTPFNLWIHIHRYSMSTRLNNILTAALQSKRLPKYAEMLTKDYFLKIKFAGVGMWNEFVRLRDELIDERMKYEPKSKESHETSEDLRLPDSGETLL